MYVSRTQNYRLSRRFFLKVITVNVTIVLYAPTFVTWRNDGFVFFANVCKFVSTKIYERCVFF